MKKFSRWITLLVFAAGPTLPAQDEAVVTTSLLQLNPSTDPERQLEALRTIATSLDPRIPAACVPMLQSPGASVQRNAARAIGSRWWQIPREELATYEQALKANLRSDDVQFVNMIRRGIGLLTQSYDGDMFSRSPSKRWVIYERHGKPCLIDTKTSTEELLGATTEGKFMPAYGNEPLTNDCHWHPRQDMVAMQVLIFRHPSLLWVWRAGHGLRTFGIDELRAVLKPVVGELSETAIYDVDFKAWKGTDLEFTVDALRDHTILLRWESASDTLRVMSDGAVK